MSRYKHAKGSIQFPLDEELPVELIKKIIKYRVDENRKKEQKKSKAVQGSTSRTS